MREWKEWAKEEGRKRRKESWKLNHRHITFLSFFLFLIKTHFDAFCFPNVFTLLYALTIECTYYIGLASA